MIGKMNKIAIVGSRKYENKTKIKNFIFKLKERFGDEVEIISGGQKYGADGYAKKFTLEFDMKYVEFPPEHYPYNQHCISERFNYGKKYNVSNYFKRNKQIAEYSDCIIAFIPKDIESSGTINTLGYAERLNKKFVIIN
jgi:predicted Rossmann fold nucleotide-binding protein DprA/Smf involved in DNA uptake